MPKQSMNNSNECVNKGKKSSWMLMRYELNVEAEIGKTTYVKIHRGKEIPIKVT